MKNTSRTARISFSLVALAILAYFGGRMLAEESTTTSERIGTGSMTLQATSTKSLELPRKLVAAWGAQEKARSKTPSGVVNWNEIKLCQSLGPAAPHPIWGVDSLSGCGQGEVGWEARGSIDWQAYAQGEYVGHARSAHVSAYRLRVDDQIDFVFRLTRQVTGFPYELQVGDKIRIESLTGDTGSSAGNGSDNSEDNIRRELGVQPDGTISLPLLGQVRAAGMTVDGLRLLLEEKYKTYYKVPAITVTPLEVNTRLQDLIAAVDARQGTGGLQLPVQVNPDGKIYLPGLGAVCAQGLTIEELKWEIDARYASTIPGVAVTPILRERAPRFVFVLGEVAQPGRFTLDSPTTLMGAIALAGGWNPGANLRQVVVFRRGDDWRLMATMLDVKGALYGRRPTPADEIWINDSDVVVVPKSPVRATNEFIEQVFTRGLYAAFPQFAFGQFNFDNFSSIGN
ncbi:polysaccharide biosynthesis/export family protein [Adhaeretor mobilis]|uniref:Polysaccharide biosynthesis/export protein n=1 Tax=Adhaeretor mobilis TaxID=1930276 RepID=A0A517MRX5_9BACT|nr:polysaccharide biosynthesis/export family protein [Adhaeretor mobilis]QDS97638.1 Polysaccharide biosynthesis/export protein [Adhaeretor mobilis]